MNAIVETGSDVVFPAGDYVSPNFQRVRPDAAFPNMVPGDRSLTNWPWFRREIPHNWYVDRRAPVVGFLDRDEAHILYNSALPFAGQRALEIGCWLGWSACHLALAGVELDVVDPMLMRPDWFREVATSLAVAGVRERINLVGGHSPMKVDSLALAFDRRWSLIFIDGDHETPGPRLDAEACAVHAADDALVLFHDLAAPAVADGLRHFRDAGWNVRVYQTMQIMGAAWRGSARPVDHRPDPSVAWVLPDHLADFADVVDGMP